MLRILKKLFGTVAEKVEETGIYGVNEWTGFTAAAIPSKNGAEFANTPERWEALWKKIGAPMPCAFPEGKAAAVYISDYEMQKHSSVKFGKLDVENVGGNECFYQASLSVERTGALIPAQTGTVWGVRIIPGPYDDLWIGGGEAFPVETSSSRKPNLPKMKRG